MMGVPRYQVAVEKAKASEAYGYLAHIAKAQEMHRARAGVYSDSLAALSIQAPAPNHFSVSAPSSINWETRWQLKLTREGAPTGFGAYSVAWCEKGFDAGRSSIPAKLTPTGVGGSSQASSGSGSSGKSGSSSSGSANSGGDSSGKGASNAAKDAKEEKDKKGNNGVGNGEGGGPRWQPWPGVVAATARPSERGRLPRFRFT